MMWEIKRLAAICRRKHLAILFFGKISPKLKFRKIKDLLLLLKFQAVIWKPVLVQNSVCQLILWRYLPHFVIWLLHSSNGTSEEGELSTAKGRGILRSFPCLLYREGDLGKGLLPALCPCILTWVQWFGHCCTDSVFVFQGRVGGHTSTFGVRDRNLSKHHGLLFQVVQPPSPPIKPCGAVRVLRAGKRGVKTPQKDQEFEPGLPIALKNGSREREKWSWALRAFSLTNTSLSWQCAAAP